MTPQEASEIIAKFMGYKKLDPPTRTSRFYISWVKDKKRMSSLDFHRSLDALVSVWKKLGYMSCNIHLWEDGKKYVEFVHGGSSLGGDNYCDNIQEAAAIATAKAIQEMGK